MEKVQDPISMPKWASAWVDKQKDITDSDKFTKSTHSSPTQIPTYLKFRLRPNNL